MKNLCDWKDYNFFLFMMITELARTEGKGSTMFIVFMFGFVVLACADLFVRMRDMRKNKAN